MTPTALELYAVARITGAHGIEGFLRITPLGDDPDRLKKLSDVLYGPGEDCAVPARVMEVRFLHSSVLLKLEGVGDRALAEGLHGQWIFVRREDLVRPRRGRWFVHEIIGCNVETDDGTAVGEVTDVMKSAAQDIWVVRDGSKEHLIPVVKEFVLSVDVKAKRIVIHPIEGLLE